MSSDTPIKGLMTREVETIPHYTSVHEALDLMLQSRLTCLPVLATDGRCIGILSLPDLMTIASESDHMIDEVSDNYLERLWVVDSVREKFGSEQVHELMSADPVSITDAATVGQAAGLMLRHNVHHLPVLNENDEIVGLVSTMDLLRTLASADTPA